MPRLFLGQGFDPGTEQATVAQLAHYLRSEDTPLETPPSTIVDHESPDGHSLLSVPEWPGKIVRVGRLATGRGLRLAGSSLNWMADQIIPKEENQDAQEQQN